MDIFCAETIPKAARPRIIKAATNADYEAHHNALAAHQTSALTRPVGAVSQHRKCAKNLASAYSWLPNARRR